MWGKPYDFLLHLFGLFILVRKEITLLLVVDVLEIKMRNMHLFLRGDVLKLVLHHFDLIFLCLEMI